MHVVHTCIQYACNITEQSGLRVESGPYTSWPTISFLRPKYKNIKHDFFLHHKKGVPAHDFSRTAHTQPWHRYDLHNYSTTNITATTTTTILPKDDVDDDDVDNNDSESYNAIVPPNISITTRLQPFLFFAGQCFRI